ncbi:hypothetical protein RclHR1_00970006 [Rhizophagus clarus]|uniref:Hsp70 family protein n=1 Tax=Rhizophagus clarus TaxID=94130 RepID=A0A2Z6SF72_9GLOM|nr:hypothetical protein RclHR1_00970006 [Rhizophagus clarus]GES96671.1 hypothetical protein GLOIN_2v1705943 [Rhizophagus clarus]
MNLLEKFEKLNNRLSNLLEENKELKQQYKDLQEENEELKENFNKTDYKNLQEENKELKERLEERDKQYQQYILNLEKQKNEQLELKRQYKNLQEESNELKQKLNERERQFLNLEKQKTNSLEENKELKRQYKNLQEDNKKSKERLNERDRQFQQQVLSLSEENKELKRQYKNLQEDNKKLKEKINERDRQFQQHILNLSEENKELKRKYESRQDNKKDDLNLIKENKELKRQNEILQEDNKKQVLNLREENRELKRQHKDFQEENKNLKEKLNERDRQFQQQVLNLSEENKELKRQSKNLQEENKNLKEKLNERDRQFQQHILNLEKQKNEQLEIFSQNLEKALGKLELDNLDEVNENDNKSLKENNKSLIDNYDDSIDYIEDPSAKEAPKKGPTSTSLSMEATMTSPPKKVPKKKSVSSKDKSNQNQHGDIRVVVGLDFGTTYSGFSYCHTANSGNIITNNQWDEEIGSKTNTVLQYNDDSYKNVKSWGSSALVKRPYKKNKKTKDINETKPVELFKLHLGNLSNNLKPHLPSGLNYKQAITDYLRKIGEMIKEKIAKSWPGIDFKQVSLVLTIPVEYSNHEIADMRDCVFNAGLIEEKYSKNLHFTTEPEAAAIYCMKNSLREYDLLTTETTFMIVDCGGGTIDLTIRKLTGNNQLGEVTESTGDFCGSTFIDKEFINYLRKKLGNSAIDSFRENYYGQFQYMIQEFCRSVKIPFTGDNSKFLYELDIQESAPNLLQYVSEETRYKMKEDEWLIEIDYDDVKAMFDPVVNKIIKLIHLQLSNARETCSAMFLVGGFSESIYLQKRIKQEFQHLVKNISVPRNPMVAISYGATLYGLSINNSENDNFDESHSVISSRILKYTYGIEVRNYWMEGDPIERKIRGGRIDRFHCLARRGIQVNINEEFTTFFTPLSPMQSRVSFRIYYTTKHDAKYCDEPGMKRLGKLIIDLSEIGHLDKLLFGFSFGQMAFAVTVKNEISGQYCRTKFEIDVNE